MNDKKFQFWQRILTFTNLIAVFVGIITAFAGNSFFLGLHNTLTKEVFFNNSEFTNDVLNLKNWLFGIIGGTIVGFHILMIMISENAFKKKEKWAYYAMWFGLLSWFIIDSGVSFYYGAFHNLWIINIPALIMISIPLIVTRKEFINKLKE
jgi:uncharacterized BrkB/YihY/UPF0761 family membrane protein